MPLYSGTVLYLVVLAMCSDNPRVEPIRSEDWIAPVRSEAIRGTPLAGDEMVRPAVRAVEGNGTETVASLVTARSNNSVKSGELSARIFWDRGVLPCGNTRVTITAVCTNPRQVPSGARQPPATIRRRSGQRAGNPCKWSASEITRGAPRWGEDMIRTGRQRPEVAGNAQPLGILPGATICPRISSPLDLSWRSIWVGSQSRGPSRWQHRAVNVPVCWDTLRAAGTRCVTSQRIGQPCRQTATAESPQRPHGAHPAGMMIWSGPARKIRRAAEQETAAPAARRVTNTIGSGYYISFNGTLLDMSLSTAVDKAGEAQITAMTNGSFTTTFST